MNYSKKFSDVEFYKSPQGEPLRLIGNMIETPGKDEPKMGFFIIPPYEKSIIDCHDVSELYFILKGKGYGLLWTEGENKEPVRYEVEKGTSVYVPKKINHQMFNTGNEDLCLVWFFPKAPDAELSKKFIKKPFSPDEWIKTEKSIEELFL